MKVTKQGRIIKGIGGFYTVLADDGSTCVCKARGLFRKQAKTPLVGDIVEFSYDEEREKRERTASESFCDAAHTAGGSNGYLMNLLPRKNELIRPAAANIDRLLIVVAASRPEPYRRNSGNAGLLPGGQDRPVGDLAVQADRQLPRLQLRCDDRHSGIHHLLAAVAHHVPQIGILQE